jgi:hypothetical protein
MSAAFEALNRLRQVIDHSDRDSAGEIADAFEALERAVHLGRAIALLEDVHPCRACGTPAADCDQRYEDTLAELCCEVCEVGDTAELHDPAGAPWVDGADDDPRWKQ